MESRPLTHPDRLSVAVILPTPTQLGGDIKVRAPELKIARNAFLARLTGRHSEALKLDDQIRALGFDAFDVFENSTNRVNMDQRPQETAAICSNLRFALCNFQYDGGHDYDAAMNIQRLRGESCDAALVCRKKFRIIHHGDEVGT